MFECQHIALTVTSDRRQSAADTKRWTTNQAWCLCERKRHWIKVAGMLLEFNGETEMSDAGWYQRVAGGRFWEWSFGFRTHWGEHATGAIRALHWYLFEVEPQSLSANV